MPAHRRLAEDPRVELVRPLLEVSRASIREYLEELGQPFREDATNADIGRTRSRIRHDLLPRLAADYNPRVAEALVRLGRLAAAEHRAFDGVVAEMTRSAILSRSGDTVVLKHGFLRSLPSYLRTEVVRRIWRELGWPEAGMSARRWQRLGEEVRNPSSPQVEIAAGVVLVVRDPFLALHRFAPREDEAQATVAADSIAVDVPGAVAVPWAGGRLVATIEAGESMDESIDLDRLVLPLSVRAAAAGDRFAPLGMGGRSTPLADFFRGRGVPRDRRGAVPLFCDREGIVWVVGHRIAERVKVTGETRARLGLRWIAER